MSIDQLTCPIPKLSYERVQMVHGAGGLAMSQLIDHLFLKHFDDAELAQKEDATIVDCPAGKLAISTDCFVVDPIFFPGGDIGSLAVNGTVNDVAMRGAKPLYLTMGFIVEEGLLLADLERIVASMQRAATAAGVRLVAGDTKVVHRGKCDGIFITTAGVGLVNPRSNLSCAGVRDGDALIVNGTLGDHGIAVLSKREGLAFETEIVSDCAALNGLVECILERAGEKIHACRDATRGGLTAVLNELASASAVAIEVDERQLPIRPGVRAACEMLGIDPMQVANEGKLVVAVAGDAAADVLAAMQDHPLGRESRLIGRARGPASPGVTLATSFGTSRILDLPVGDPLPRIC